MATMKDVAIRARVSTATVSRVLSRNGEKVSEDTLQRVAEAAKDLGYQPNHLPRNLRYSSSRTFALIISDIANPFFPAVARGCEDAAQESGYSVVLSNTDENPERELSSLRVMAAERAAGVMVASTGKTHEGVRALLGMGIPVVALDRLIEDIEIDSVTVDNNDGAYQAVDHLVQEGHTRIAMISGPQWASSIRDRQFGYERALRAHGLEGRVSEGNLRPDGGYAATLEVLASSPTPTAIFSVNNQTTVGVLRAIAERGVPIPEDISIIGFDDLPTGELLIPPLSVVSQPSYELGARAVELLLRRIDDPTAPYEHVVLKPTLTLRASTSSPTGRVQ
ncbi:MAG: LacI family transcriptional regulator [Actinobacteria bacterium]|nr:LacI family transcriptional regulator [Actinomycetota bacterium]